jgi:hypothetical protein
MTEQPAGNGIPAQNDRFRRRSKGVRPDPEGAMPKTIDWLYDRRG